MSTLATSTRIAPPSRGLTNADWDHPDVFADRAAVVAAFAAWVRGFDGGGESPLLVANVGDAGVREVLAVLRDWPGRLVVVAVVEEPGGSPGRLHRPASRRTPRPPGQRGRSWLAGSTEGEGSLEIRGLSPAPP